MAKPKNKKEYRRNIFQSSATIPQRIIGAFLMLLGALLSLLLIGIPLALIFDTGKEAIVPIGGVALGGLLLFIIGFDIYKDGFGKSPNKTVTHYFNVGEDASINGYRELKTGEFPLFDGMDGHEFEYFCAEILKENGFSNVRVTPGSGDQGVDILATKDGIKYAIQCKNYASSLGNTPIQEVHAGKAFYNCHVGVVMTNSIFTTGAKELAKATGVLLWDRTTLQKMIEEAEPTIDIED